MIHPAFTGARNLIFDMDGTLIASGRIAVHSLRSSVEGFYRDHGEPDPGFSDADLVKGIGAPSDEFYKALLPDALRWDWENFRSRVFQAEHNQLNSHRITFPGALKTLEMLRRRGYTLALVSNCGRSYMDAVLDTQGLRSKFDVNLCIGDENGATKTNLIARLKDQFSGRTVVIGDRHYDVEAAAANDLPSIGCLYGYGTREELANTTSWVEDVRHLAFVFNPLRELAGDIADRVERLRPIDRPFVLGLDIPHETLAHPFSEHLLTALSDRGIPTLHLRMEEHRLKGDPDRDSAEQIREAYPWDRLNREVLAARLSGSIDTRFAVTQPVAREQVGDSRPLRVRNGQVLVVEGPFLQSAAVDQEQFDTLIQVSAKPSSVDRVLRSTQGFERHSEISGARTMPFWEEHLDHLRNEWESSRRRLAQACQKELAGSGSSHVDVIVDGDRLPRGEALLTNWRDGIA